MTEKSTVCQYISKTRNPLVSVIIPVHNVCLYLPQCLESVIHQTYHNIEIIIIEDGSTDDSKSICDQYEYNDNRITVIHTESNGLACARNLGIDKAKGTYISFIDSDDWMELHTIQTLVKLAMQLNADIICAKNCSEYVGRTVHSQGERNQVQSFHGEKILPAYANGLFRETVWNKLYRYDCIAQIKYPDGHNYEDVFTTWKLMRKLADEGGTVVSISEELFHFRVRKSSITHTANIQNVVDCWNAYYERYKGLPEYQKKFTASCYKAIVMMWINYSCFTREEKKNAKNTVLEMLYFSKETSYRILRGDYSLSRKMFSLISLASSPLLMWLCSFGYIMYRLLRKKCTDFIMFE